MPDTREKLIELLSFFADGYSVENRHIGDRTKVCEIADHLIAHGVTVQEWISVKDRLPEVLDSCLVVVIAKYEWETEYDINVDVATYNPYENAYIDDCWNTYNDWDEGQQYLHITHWMPMPQPPKGE